MTVTSPPMCGRSRRRGHGWVALGRMGEALGWVREQGLSVEDDLSYLREFEHITLARVLLARHATEPAGRSLHEAPRLLERLLQAAEDGGRIGSVVEILVLQALATRCKATYQLRWPRCNVR
jgi:LuxR family transcriptional regulator, maltose regulon positive regulatory protein